ncbi:MAG: 2Fe-2S iron-sulfur cluster binding domain-containing protein [Spirochaetes bacterium]|nr:2Fe-2S iron-sulfur cluster binding domain-containing protein [Spirochaetota bacterium]
MALDLHKMQNYDRLLEQMNEFRERGTDYRSLRGRMSEVMDRLHPKRLRLEVAEIIQETPSAKTFRLVAPDRSLPPFLPGQYITVYTEVQSVATARAYSLSSAPADSGHYDITVRRLAGGLVSGRMLDRWRVGDTIEASSPSGNFYHNRIIHDRSVVYLAGGSGITPFMSMIRQEATRPAGMNVCLLYGSNSDGDIIFHDELNRLAEGNARFRYVPVVEKPGAGYRGKTGYLTADLIREVLGDVEGRTFFLCGPGAMYDFCIRQLEALGVPRRKIRREMFGALPDITRHRDWPAEVNPAAEFSVQIKGKDTIKAKAGDSLLTSLEKNGLKVPSLCRSGECSYCRVKLLSGRVFQPKESLVRSSDRRFGYIHSCMSYPLTDLEILL